MFECKRLCCAFEATHQFLQVENKRQLFLTCFLWSLKEARVTKGDIQARDRSRKKSHAEMNWQIIVLKLFRHIWLRSDWDIFQIKQILGHKCCEHENWQSSSPSEPPCTDNIHSCLEGEKEKRRLQLNSKRIISHYNTLTFPWPSWKSANRIKPQICRCYAVEKNPKSLDTLPHLFWTCRLYEIAKTNTDLKKKNCVSQTCRRGVESSCGQVEEDT